MGKQTQIIKLDATDSTNRYLKDRLHSGPLADHTVVWAENQRLGRGQMGTIWQSEPGKNLTFSMLKYFEHLEADRHFLLNMGVSLALCEALGQFSILNVKIKWPNDIMSGNQKICGILIENALQGSRLRHSIIGIGLNVNQEGFGALDRAGSLKSITGREFDLEHLLGALLGALCSQLGVLERRRMAELMPAYDALLFRKDLPSPFKRTNGTNFMGIVRGVGEHGKLLLEEEGGPVREVDLKEVRLLY